MLIESAEFFVLSILGVVVITFLLVVWFLHGPPVGRAAAIFNHDSRTETVTKPGTKSPLAITQNSPTYFSDFVSDTGHTFQKQKVYDVVPTQRDSSHDCVPPTP